MLVGMFVTFTMTFVAAILTAAAMPIADRGLARADLLLFGFHHAWLTGFSARHDWFWRAMFWVYASFGWMPQLLVAALFLTGRARTGWMVASALMLTLAAVIYLSWLLPA